MPTHFIAVAQTGALPPGSMRCVEVGGKRVLLVNVGGRYFATDDTCTHEDASLSTGVLKGELVRCPLHGSRFNVCTGKVLEEPAEADLATYPVRVDGAQILVDLGGAVEA